MSHNIYCATLFIPETLDHKQKRTILTILSHIPITPYPCILHYIYIYNNNNNILINNLYIYGISNRCMQCLKYG